MDQSLVTYSLQSVRDGMPISVDPNMHRLRLQREKAVSVSLNQGKHACLALVESRR